MKTENRPNGIIKLLSLFLVTIITVQSSAIIIRHDRGYGSYLVRESKFPAVFFLERQGGRKVCVATVIHTNWAITAAHCVNETGLAQSLANGNSFNVVIGRRDRAIDAMVIHPDYVPDLPTEVDLALLRFKSPLDFPSAISLNHSDDELHKVVTILGWGFFGIGTTGRQYDDGEFRMAQNRVEEAERRLVIRFDDPRELDAKVVDLEGMPGLGDSGGPALLELENGWALAGVAVGELMDEGFSEETQGSYGSIAIYERISQHRDWISSTIDK